MVRGDAQQNIPKVYRLKIFLSNFRKQLQDVSHRGGVVVKRLQVF